MKKLKAAFLNPPFLKKYSRPQRSPAVTKSGTLYYPMWLSYSAALAKAQGADIDLIDAPADDYDLDYVINKMNRFCPDLIVMDTSTPSIHNDVRICETIKTSLPNVFILLVGTHVSALPCESIELSEAIDAIAVGEYDLTVKDVIEALVSGSPIDNISGLCYKREGKVILTAKRALIDDLDSLPFVSPIYKEFLNTKNYFNPNALFPMVTITTSRGCPYECTFCVYPQTMMGHKMRLRSADNVVEEIEYITKNFNPLKAVFFEDDTFTVVKKRCIEISEKILSKGINISWTANARASLDYETMKIMKRSGCRCLCVGFESGSQELLDNIKKSITADNMRSFMENAKRAGILIHGCFIVGLPGETNATMTKTLELAKALNPDTVQFYPIMVYPGTEAYNWYSERGLITTEDFSKWLTAQGLHNSVIKTQNLSSEELVKFCDYARKSFYLRPSYLLYKLRQSFLDSHERQRNIKSAKTFIKYLMRGSDVTNRV
ncbi:radical SAM domain-containing protein [Candidatus Magnetoovum chiemensis]|nr:radical SAM domain-containing protein [Candidatus Magnetoovum chiemensis]